MTRHACEAYARRAGEYIDRFGGIASVHPADLELVTRWARGVDGPVLDAGCGPGQWTAHLAGMGVEARGVDGVGEFVDHARRAHPECRFDEADLEALPLADASMSGVLAWYSLIHHEPAAVLAPLREFARILRPGGKVLLGYFHGTGGDRIGSDGTVGRGSAVERFDHAVTTAYRWPVEALTAWLGMAHFEVIETHTRTGAGYRPHGAVVARLSSGPA